MKINDATTKDNLPRFVHQATVRREVVKRHIKMMKNRGRRAYVHVDIEAMEKKAEQLPTAGVPPEIVRLLPRDTTLDKLVVQKNATPCDGARDSIEAAARDMNLRTPNAVMMESRRSMKWTRTDCGRAPWSIFRERRLR